MSDSDKIIPLSRAGSRPKKDEAPKNEHETEENEKKELVYCSFCGRPNTQTAKMVQGPGVNICSECTMIAVQYLILEDRLPSSEAQKILDIFWSKVK